MKSLRVRFERKLDLARPIRGALERAGWTVTSGENWHLLWSAMRDHPDTHRSRKPGQIIRHIFGGWVLNNKSLLHQVLDRAATRESQLGLCQRYDFHPKTFTLSRDLADLKNEAARRPDARWILKPAQGGEGIGVSVLRGVTDLIAAPDRIVQEYLAPPHLLDGFRYTLRVFLLITSLDPLVAYMYPDGLVKRAARPYTSDPSVTDPFIHITNTRIVRTDPGNDGTVRNLSIAAYRCRLRDAGIDDEQIWHEVRRLAIATVIAARDPILDIQRAREVRAEGSFEIVGLDIAIDAELKPWLLECNTNPGFGIGGVPGSEYAHIEKNIKTDLLGELGTMLKVIATWDRSSGSHGGNFVTPEDVLTRAATEYSARGRFERIFPGADVVEHFAYFPYPRYYDILLAREVCPGFVTETTALRPRSDRGIIEGGNLVLTTSKGSTFHSRNPTTAYVWAACADGLTVQDMVSELEEQFPHAGVALEHDVRNALADLLEAGVLEYASSYCDTCGIRT